MISKKYSTSIQGHQLEFNRQIDVGECDFTWNKEYGDTWRIDDAFGVSKASTR
jgi:hypothetical protein